eukprot:TRINITY_DN13583_c0_g2_i1.p1 TRINITY_DN13583_c0_g2~~TRINITY_DN13583_c0_g2_i1.p1  ORF type:complete len:487 (+),score=153.67 TRINITY_DN13583_c0_g2_i1:63-1463(+)
MTARPGMPVFEPSHDPEALRLYMSAPEAGEGEAIVLPDDPAFIAEFSSQFRLMSEAQLPPLEEIYLGANRVPVNRKWASKFTRSWETFNCHTVRVAGVEGVVSFRACHQFWEEMKREIETFDGIGNDGEVIDVTTNREPTRLHCSNNRWNDLVSHWEALNSCTQTHRERILSQRGADPAAAAAAAAAAASAAVSPPPGQRYTPDNQYQDVDGVIPVPHMALPLANVHAVPAEQFADDDNTNFDFRADGNFWKCLQRFSAWVPEASHPPVFAVGSEGDQLVVSRVFMRRFIQAWRELFPYTVIIATADHSGKVVSTFFNAHSAVWHELTLRSSGSASPDNQRSIPPGFYLARTMEDATSPPILLKAQAYREVVRLWPDQFPSDGKSIGMQLKEDAANRVKPRPAPCVSLPKPDRPGKRRRPAGAPKSRPDEVPTVNLCLHKDVFDGIRETGYRYPKQYAHAQKSSIL